MLANEPDSQPIDFHAFIPTHDPSLGVPIFPDPSSTGPSQSISHTPGQIASQDEAFQRALSAMYWGGYWTAVYHYQRNLIQQQKPEEPSTEETAVDDVNENAYEVDEDMDDDLVPTQR